MRANERTNERANTDRQMCLFYVCACLCALHQWAAAAVAAPFRIIINLLLPSILPLAFASAAVTAILKPLLGRRCFSFLSFLFDAAARWMEASPVFGLCEGRHLTDDAGRETRR